MTWRSLPDGFRVRTATHDDAEAVNGIVVAMDEAVQGWSESTVDSLREEWEDLGSAQEALLVEDRSGRPVAYMDLAPRGSDTIMVDAYVHPQAWGRGIGTAIVRASEVRARQRGAGRVRNAVLAADRPACALLEREGYLDARHFYRMLIDLSAPPPPAEWPDGVTVDPFDLADARALHAAVEEAFAEEWGHRTESFEQWEARRLKRERFDPTLWFVAKEGDRIAGAVICDRTRYDMGWIASVSVGKPWRRRGLGLALLRHAFGEFYQRGERRIGLGVDAQNPTGATRLYERAGMQVAWEAAVFVKELTPAAAATL